MSGEVEILSGWDGAHPFAVMHWSRSGDSGWTVGSFTDRREAVRCALAFARENGCDVHNAEIIRLCEVSA